MSAAPLTPLSITCSPYRIIPQWLLRDTAVMLRQQHFASMATELEKHIPEVTDFEGARALISRFVRLDADVETLNGTSPAGAADLLRTVLAKNAWHQVDITVRPGDRYVHAEWYSDRGARRGAQGFGVVEPLLTSAFVNMERGEQGRTLARLAELMGLFPHHPGNKPFWGSEFGKLWFSLRLAPHRGKAAVLSEEKLEGDHAHPAIFTASGLRQLAEEINAQAAEGVDLIEFHVTPSSPYWGYTGYRTDPSGQATEEIAWRNSHVQTQPLTRVWFDSVSPDALFGALLPLALETGTEIDCLVLDEGGRLRAMLARGAAASKDAVRRRRTLEDEAVKLSGQDDEAIKSQPQILWRRPHVGW